MDCKIDITNDNVAKYVTKRTLTVNGGVWDGEKMPIMKMFIACFFFPLSLVFISALGYYLVEGSKTRNTISNYFELRDFIAWFIHRSFYLYVGLGIVFFVLFIIILFSNFYCNKVLRAKRIMIMLYVYLFAFTVEFFFFSCLFIPITIGSGMRYFLIIMCSLIFLSFMWYWLKKRKNIFYKVTEQSTLDKFLRKVRVWIWPILGISSTISFATAPATRESRLAFYAVVSPFTILLVLPFVYATFYYCFGEILELYYINKYPEAIRMETNFTKEEWYGPKYQKSKEVMQKIKEFEDYINN